MHVFSSGEGISEYQVGVAVVSDHNVSVITARMNWEAARVVSIQFTDGGHMNVKFVRPGLREYVFLWACCWYLFLGGSDPLYFLNKVDQDGSCGGWAILGGVSEGKARPGGVITGTHGF